MILHHALVNTPPDADDLAELPFGEASWQALPEAERLRRLDDWLERHGRWVLERAKRADAEIRELQRRRGFFGLSTSV